MLLWFFLHTIIFNLQHIAICWWWLVVCPFYYNWGSYFLCLLLVLDWFTCEEYNDKAWTNKSANDTVVDATMQLVLVLVTLVEAFVTHWKQSIGADATIHKKNTILRFMVLVSPTLAPTVTVTPTVAEMLMLNRLRLWRRWPIQASSTRPQAEFVPAATATTTPLTESSKKMVQLFSR